MKRIVLVGPGHAHLFVLEAWAKKRAQWGDAELVLVSIQPVQHYSGMLSGHLAGDYPEEALTFDLREICRGIGARLVTGGAVDLDPDRHSVKVASGEVLEFDLASVDVGSMPAADDLPGVAERAFTVKPIHRGLALRQVLGTNGPLVVAGGGVGGVELALCLQARSKRPVHLISATSELPAHADAALVESVKKVLTRRGIGWTTNARVTRVEADHVELSSGERLPAEHVLWVTGSRPPPLLPRSGAAVDRFGYLLVRDTLQSTSHPALFAAGDCVSFASGMQLTRNGVYSVRQGPVLAHNLREQLAGGTLLPFEPQAHTLVMINCGDGTAIAGWNGFSAHGGWVMRLKDRIDRRFMRRFQRLGRMELAQPGFSPRLTQDTASDEHHLRL